AGTSRGVSAVAAVTRAPACAAQIAARWLLPLPSGPVSSMTRAGQSGQWSISVSAAALPGPSRKSSRDRLSRCGRASVSWRGGTQEPAWATGPTRTQLIHVFRSGLADMFQPGDQIEANGQ